MRGRLLLVGLLVLPVGVGSALPAADSSAEPIPQFDEEAAEGDERPVLLSLDRWPPSQTVQRGLEATGSHVVDRFSFAKVLLVQTPAPLDTMTAIPGVEEAYPDAKLDPLLASTKPAIGLDEELQSSSLSAEGVNIAVVDSGVDADNPGLDEAVAAQYTVDDDGVEQGSSSPSKHGTHVAGILAGSGEGASTDRGDVEGVAPDAGLISLDISDQFTTSNALRAFEWIYENHEQEDIRVVVNAWGRMRDPANYDPEDPIVRASDALVDDGVVVVFSAGNGGPSDSKMTVEATNPNVISVGATTDEGEVESYSSRGPVYQNGEQVNWTKPDLVAPGSHVVSTSPSQDGQNYVTMNGTSMAAPHAGAAAALLISRDASLSPAQVGALLKQGARDVGPAGVDDVSGAGMVDIQTSLSILEDTGGETERVSRSSQHSGELTGPAQAGTVFSTASINSEDSFEIEVPANATQIDSLVTWDGRSALSVEIQRPDGSVAESASITDHQPLEVQDPKAGTWTVHLEPEDASRGTYQANTTVTWLEAIEGTDIPVTRQKTTSGTFPSTGGSFGLFGGELIPGVPNIVAMAVGSVLTATTIAQRRTSSKSETPTPPDAK